MKRGMLPLYPFQLKFLLQLAQHQLATNQLLIQKLTAGDKDAAQATPQDLIKIEISLDEAERLLDNLPAPQLAIGTTRQSTPTDQTTTVESTRIQLQEFITQLNHDSQT